MHGILFKGLKDHVAAEYGDDAWAAAMDEAGVEPKLYLPVTDYPDEEALALVDGAAAATGAERATLLADVGAALAPLLLDTFGVHVADDWDVIDLLARPGNEVFVVLGGAEDLSATREGDDRMALEYTSDLELCDLARGLLEGLGEQFGEPLEVSEAACVHDGAGACEFAVVRA